MGSIPGKMLSVLEEVGSVRLVVSFATIGLLRLLWLLLLSGPRLVVLLLLLPSWEVGYWWWWLAEDVFFLSFCD